MKRYLILATLVALSLLLLLVWPRNGRHANKPENSDEPKQALAVGDSSGQSDRGMKTEPPPAVAAPVFVVTNQSNEFEHFVRESTEAANVPIAFYGKVLDQDSNPLQNVSVDLQVSEERVDDYPQHNERITPVRRQTDAEGKFEVVESSLRGRLVLVSVLTKAGYEREIPGRAMFGTQSTSLDNPAVFRMWSTNIPHEQLITGDFSSPVIPDGRRYGIDITNRAVIEGAEGDLTVWLKRPAKVGWEKYDWSCELDANGGLLEETGDQAMLIAPETGYNNVFTFNQEADSNDWTGGLYGKRFYLRLHNGQIYGRITVDLDVDLTTLPTHKAPAGLRIHYVINPSGSRLLR